MIKKLTLWVSGAFSINFLFIKTVLAHCPLCTIGVGAAALGASALGLSAFSVGIFLGAFGMAIGLWIARLIRKKIIPLQNIIIGIFSFLTTILPLKPLFFDNSAIFISLYGDYGSWLNRTYYVDKFLIGSVLGAVIVFLSPAVSKMLSRIRKNAIFPFQGMIITLVLLILASLLFEILK